MSVWNAAVTSLPTETAAAVSGVRSWTVHSDSAAKPPVLPLIEGDFVLHLAEISQPKIKPRRQRILTRNLSEIARDSVEQRGYGGPED